jgi:hypothetical protein
VGEVVQLHIPKTAGSALRHALRGVPGVVRWGHSYALQTAAPGRRYLVTLRDPVARFLSAYTWDRPRITKRGPTTAEELALSLDNVRTSDLVTFRPQVAWVESAERLRQPDILWVGRTETLDADFERLRELLDLDETHQLPPHGHKRRNDQLYDHPLSPAAEVAIREHYAADCALLEAL